MNNRMDSYRQARPEVAPGRWGVALVLAFLVLAVGSISYLALVWLPEARAEAMSDWGYRLVATADDRRAAVHGWISDLRADARTLAMYPTGRYLVEGRHGPPYPFDTNLGPEQHLRELYGQFVKIHGRAFAALYDAEATRVVSSGSEGATPDSALRSMVRATVAGAGRPDLRVHEGRLVILAVPVRDEAGRTVGVVTVGTDARPFLIHLLQSEPVQSRTGETLLVTRQGDQVAYITPLRKADLRPGGLMLPVTSPRLAGAAAVRGASGLDEYVDYHGADVLAALTPIEDTPWSLVAKADVSEVMADFRSELTRVVLAVLGLLIGALGVAFGAWWWQRQRLAQSHQLLEQQLQQAQKMEAIGRLAGGVAHDFNNILTTIQGHAALVLEELETGHPIADGVQEIHRAAQRAGSLTRQLLTFSRRQPMQPGIVDVGRIVREMEPMLRRLIGADIALNVSVQDGAPLTILADPTRIEQVMLNLVVNARDAMPDGGRLDLDIREVSGSAAGPSGADLGDRAIQVTVADTGIGMDPETKAQIFEPFFTTKGAEHGTGLGLSMVYGIVEQSGGAIDVDSDPGSGTRFIIRFPAATGPEAVEAAANTPRPTPEAPSSATILLVEDERGVRELARRVLERQGHRVLVAQSGAEALKRVESLDDPLDLVVTDMVMPGLDGRDLANRIREVHPGCPVLLMSGYSEEAVARKTTLSPKVTFIEKPFTPAELAHRVAESLQKGADGTAPDAP